MSPSFIMPAQPRILSLVTQAKELTLHKRVLKLQRRVVFFRHTNELEQRKSSSLLKIMEVCENLTEIELELRESTCGRNAPTSVQRCGNVYFDGLKSFCVSSLEVRDRQSACAASAANSVKTLRLLLVIARLDILLSPTI